MKLFAKIFDSNEKQVVKLQPQIDAVNSWEAKVKKLTDSKLKEKTSEFKKRYESGETLDDLLPEAFAVVREGILRTIGQRAYDVQLMAAITIHQGQIAEQRTGEGKTHSAAIAAYLNALSGKGVHIVTVNDYLARRDAGWYGKALNFLGLEIGCIIHDHSFVLDSTYKDKDQKDERLAHLREVSKKDAYNADVTYGTNNEFGFDYLRDNMVWQKEQFSQRGHNFAIVDEVDSILIDEARTPLIISSPAEEATDKYVQFSRLVKDLSSSTDFVLEEKTRSASLTEHGILKVEKRLGVPNLYEKDFSTVHHIEQALKAQTLYHRDRDYVVKEGEIVIVDEFTGRLLPGRRYSDGLHQAIEAKEGVPIQKESKTLATISFQNYFRLYDKLSGMTGTAATESEEFHKIYKLEVVIIPTNKPMVRKDHSDVVYKTARAKFTAVANEVGDRNNQGQPVLIGTTSIEKNELLSSLLKRKKIPHIVLNAKNHLKEAEIIAQAGTKGAVTLATNIAGRGVDIILGGTPPMDESGRLRIGTTEYKAWEKRHEDVVKLGGLHIVGTERHESRRIDNQLRGRAGRQGDPGSSKFYVSLEDDIMRLFGGDSVAKIMGMLRLPEDTPIEHGMVSKAIENAQSKIEGHNFDSRKHLVEYDDVANRQREIVYNLRKEVIFEEDFEKLTNKILEKVEDEISAMVIANSAEGFSKTELEKVASEFLTIVPFDEGSQKEIFKEIDKLKEQEKIINFLVGVAKNLYGQRKQTIGKEQAGQIDRFAHLSVIDTLWVEHLDTLDDLREGIGLRGYSQRDPLVEYKKEAFDLFEKLMANIDYEIVRRVFKIQIQNPNQQAEQPAAPTGVGVSTSTSVTQVIEQGATEDTGYPVAEEIPTSPAIAAEAKVAKIGRNDPCPCGSGLKWKKCGLINAPTHKI
ncbi:MAG TPA: preprotein translocase subunit SecA [Patescibacteria group bacterium]